MATRRERVILELQDEFTTPILKAAAATELLDKKLNSLSGSAVESSKATRSLDKDVDGLGKKAKTTERDIDKLSGRLRILADVAAVLAPALAPIGAVGIAGVSGLASQLGFATVGAGVAVLAFQGVGDTLKAVNKAALEPTVENLEAAKSALAALSPEAQGFVTGLRGMAPELERLRDIAAEGLFPGLSRGLAGMETALPRVERLISTISAELGDIAGDAGQSLGSERWAPFLDFVGTEGPQALSELADALGNTVHGLAELWMATDPINDGFSSWLVGVTEDFDRWAAGLSETQGFQEFIDYIQTNGPRVAETAGAIGNAFLQVAEAIAPLGGPSLQILESIADAIAAIADSDAGPAIFGIVAAMGALNTATRIYESMSLATFGGPGVARIRGADKSVKGLSGSLKEAAKNGGILAAAFIALDTGGDIIDSFGRQREASSGAAKSYEELGKKIQDSNVGKFAEDFGVDLERLTADIAEFGDKGEYYKEVTDKFGAANDGLGGKFDMLKGFLTPMISETEKAGLANFDLANITENTATGLEAMGVQVDKTTGSLITNEEAAERTRAATEALKTAARETGGQFLEFGAELNDSRFSLDEFIDSMRDKAIALEEFADNSVKAGKRGLRDGLIKELQAAGPEGALRMRQLANGTDAEIRRANAAWRRGRKAIQDYVAIKVPTKKIDVDISDAVAGIRRVKKLLNSLGGTLGDVVPDFTPPEEDGTGADGTTVPKTGKPYADRHLYLLADGEEVISNRRGQADRYRPLLKAINNAANGTTVGTPYDYTTNGAPSGASKDQQKDQGKKGRDKAAEKRGEAALRRFEAQLDKSSKALDKERSKREALLAKADEIRSSITSGYRSDIFASDSGSNIWSSNADRAKSGKGDVFSTLMGDTANLGALSSATALLKKKGLNGAALADLLSNGSLDQVQAFANGSAADVQRYENLYNQREKALTSAGNAGANAAFGPQLAAAKAAVIEARKLNARFQRAVNLLERNPKATAAELAKAIRGAAPKRPRKGN